MTIEPPDTGFGPTSMGTCAYCGHVGAVAKEHTFPASRGGQDGPSNIVASCVYCNAEKAARTPDEWAADRVRVGLSWPPMAWGAFADGLAEALGEDAMDVFNDQIAAPAVKAATMRAFRSARRNPHFTFPAAAAELTQAAVRAAGHRKVETHVQTLR